MMRATRSRARIIPFREWPRETRERWDAGRSPRSILDPDRFPVRWGDLMSRNVVAAYGAWLGWGILNGRGAAPGGCPVVPSRSDLAAYGDYLLANFADATVTHRILH